MTKIYSRFSLLLLVFVLTSCEDILDQAPDGKVSLDEVFSDHNRVAAFLNTCYTNIPTYGNEYWYNTRGPVVASDEAWDADDIDYPSGMGPRMYNGDAAAGNYPMTDMVGFQNVSNGLYWERYFEAIRNCAYFIGRIETAAVNNDTDRARWKAEAHILRAFYYLELLKWYGTGLPLISEPFSLDTDFSTVKRASYYETVQFIIEDCNNALATASLPWRITNQTEAYRVTKAMAEAIKSRAILYAASPLYNEGEDHWQEAYEVNKAAVEALETNGYQLYNALNFPSVYKGSQSYLPNHTANFPADQADEYTTAAAILNEYYTRDLDFTPSPRDRETIYSHWAPMNGNFHAEGVGAQAGYRAATCPSQELVDAFETINGQTILNLDNPYLDERHTQPNYNPANSLYDPQNPYEKRDPRFYASIYYNGSERYCYWHTSLSPENLDNYTPDGNNGFGFATRTISTWKDDPLFGISENVRYRTRTGYYLRKFISPNAGSFNEIPGPREKIFRLAEILLNFAEAAAHAGYADEAIAVVNEVRARAAMPPLSGGFSKEELILRIRNERRVELALEGHRFFDVRRWQEPDGDLSATDKWVTAMEITRHTNAGGEFSHFTYRRRPVRLAERQSYTNKYLKAPIPQAEVNKIFGVSGENWQNPGW